MIVEPVPAAPRSRRRRLATRAGLAVPVLLLAAVIGAALVGESSRPPRPSLLAVVPTATPAPSRATRTPSPPTGTSGLRVATDPTPTELDGMRVRSVAQVLAERAAGALDPPTGLLAIAGYLGTPEPEETCTAAGSTGSSPVPLPGPLCTRESILALVRWSLAGSEGFSGIGPHIHVVVPIGVQLPEGVARTAMLSAGGPIGVVVFGRFRLPPPDGCRTVVVDCDQGFVLESVAWANGLAVSPRPVIDRGLGAGQPEWTLSNQTAVTRAALGDGGVPLVTALVRPGSLAAFDAHAAAAVRPATPAGLVWYVRGIAAAGAGTTDLAWAVVDDVTLDVLASGRVAPAGLAAGRSDRRAGLRR